MEYGLSGKTNKNQRHKTGTRFHQKCKIYFQKQFPEHNSKMKLCTRIQKNKTLKCFGSDNYLPVLYCPQMRTQLEKMDMLSWNQSSMDNLTACVGCQRNI